MAFFCRINQSKLKSLSDQFKRHYFQISYAASLDSVRTAKHVSGYVERIIPRRPADFADNVRFYAAPVQFQGKAKKEEKDTSGPRLNDKIKADFVRLVSDDGHTILPLHEALERACQLKLDLVEVQQKANPPVCKIMDFHRQKYEQKIREKDRVKSKAEASLKKGGHKEVRFTGKTEEKDLRIKADTVKRLMESGYRVKCSARGGENQDLGGLLSRLSALIEDVAIVESGPSVEKGQAYVIVRHVKFGPSKKGGGGKASKVVANAKQKVQNGTTPLVSAGSSSPDVEEMDPEESEPEDVNVSDLPKLRQLPDSSIKADNRYKKIEPTNRFQPPNVADRYSQGARDPLRSEPQNRDQWRHPPRNTNFSPSMREARRYDNNNSASRNINHSSNEMSKPGPSHHTESGPSRASFGIFSSQNSNAPGKQDAPATSYQGNRGPLGNPNAPKAAENTKFSMTNSKGNLNKGQKSWGIFSKGSPNDTPDRISKSN